MFLFKTWRSIKCPVGESQARCWWYIWWSHHIACACMENNVLQLNHRTCQFHTFYKNAWIIHANVIWVFCIFGYNIHFHWWFLSSLKILQLRKSLKLMLHKVKWFWVKCLRLLLIQPLMCYSHSTSCYYL